MWLSVKGADILMLKLERLIRLLEFAPVLRDTLYSKPYLLYSMTDPLHFHSDLFLFKPCLLTCFCCLQGCAKLLKGFIEKMTFPSQLYYMIL